MKTRLPIYCVASLLAMAPFASHAETDDSIRQCMDNFASQHFPNQPVTFVVQETAGMPMPLIAQSGTQSVKLVATGRSSGREYATATCDVKGSGVRSGTVTVLIDE